MVYHSPGAAQPCSYLRQQFPPSESYDTITRLTGKNHQIKNPKNNFKSTPPTPPFEITPPCGAASEAEAGDDENDSTSTEVQELEDYPDQENQ